MDQAIASAINEQMVAQVVRLDIWLAANAPEAYATDGDTATMMLAEIERLHGQIDLLRRLAETRNKNLVKLDEENELLRTEIVTAWAWLAVGILQSLTQTGTTESTQRGDTK